MPKLSIVIPAYNEEHTLVRCVERVLAIAAADLELEILIVDDASRILLATFLIVSAALSGVRFVVKVRSCLEDDDIILLLCDTLV